MSTGISPSASSPANLESKNNVELKFDSNANHAMLKKFLNAFPVQYQSLDPNRMTILYFTISGLDILGQIESISNKQAIIDWVYAQQVLPASDGDVRRCGFASAPNSGSRFDPELNRDFQYHEGNIAMTYSALCILKILGDDYSRVNKSAVIGALKNLQLESGSFRCLARNSEDDMRFVYCACSISELLNDWSGFDTDLTTKFIINCQALDGGFAMNQDQEGHGGSTYCAVASLSLLRKLDRIKNKKALVRWCVNRQGNGFQGRPYKDPDTCYSYWIGATMKLLNIYHFTSRKENQQFNLRCAFKYGGFSKVPDAYPDILHSYFSLAGLSMMGLDSPSLLEIDPSLGLTTRASPNPKVGVTNLDEWIKH